MAPSPWARARTQKLVEQCSQDQEGFTAVSVAEVSEGHVVEGAEEGGGAEEEAHLEGGVS